jgi:hypothetical protein
MRLQGVVTSKKDPKVGKKPVGGHGYVPSDTDKKMLTARIASLALAPASALERRPLASSVEPSPVRRNLLEPSVAPMELVNSTVRTWDVPSQSPHCSVAVAKGNSRNDYVFTRLLPSPDSMGDWTFKKYEPQSGNVSVRVWGQRKLLMSEIEFFTKFLEPGTVVVYAGAAPAKHVLCLLEMFSDYEFVLIDPAPFNARLIQAASSSKNRTKLTLINSLFTAELVAHYASLEARKLFICDIRSGDPSMPEFESVVAMDMSMQMGWHNQLKCEASMLKFRLPYAPGKTTYLDGDIYLPVWGPRTTTECRLVALKDCGVKEYDNQQYEEAMCFFNHCIRGSVYCHEYTENSCGLDHCYDCTAELHILTNYYKKIDPDSIKCQSADLSVRICRILGDKLFSNKFTPEEKKEFNRVTQGITPSPYSTKVLLNCSEFTFGQYVDIFLKCNTLYTEYGSLQRLLPVLTELDMCRLAPGLNNPTLIGIFHEIHQLLHGLTFHYTVLKLSMMVQHSQLRQLQLESGLSDTKLHEFPEEMSGCMISRYEQVAAYPMEVEEWRGHWRSMYDIKVSNPKLVTRPLRYIASKDVKDWIEGNGQYSIVTQNWKLSSVAQTSPSSSSCFTGPFPRAIFVEGTDAEGDGFDTKPENVLFDKGLEIVNQYLDLQILANVGAMKRGESIHPWSGRKYPVIGTPVPSGSFKVAGDYAACELIHANAEKFMKLVLADFTFAHYVTLHALDTIFISNLEAATVAYEYLGHYNRLVGKPPVEPVTLKVPSLRNWKGENYLQFSEYV